MLFIFPKWRFWNQIFQYMFAKYISNKNEKIFTMKMEYFDIIDEKNSFIIFNWINLYRYLNYWLNKFFSILARLRIITWIYQNIWYYNWYRWRVKWYYIKKWLFKNLKYIDWYFIYEDKHIVWEKININKKYINNAKNIVNSLDKNNYKVFIHIRRWDYLERSVMWKNNLSLSIEFYKNQIEYFLNKYKNINFIFLSDDIKYCKEEFSYISKISYFSNNDLWTDFTLMTLCDWAIISASTLSYLWAYFMDNKIEIFAPNYWLWFKNKIWYPSWIETEKFSYRNID